MGTSRVDVVIIGGGVAGLWSRWRLATAGYSIVLVERTKLGDGQTVASQGILHRGVKYALSSGAARAAAAADESARAWDGAMSGGSGPDLSGVEVVAKNMLMWTDAGLLSKLTGAIASKVFTSHVSPADPADIPTFVDMRSRSVYRVSEMVINPVSVLRCLAVAAAGPIVQADVRSISRGDERTLVETSAGTFDAGAVVLSAGEGNSSLLEMLGHKPDEWMQKRELHMVVASDVPGMLFGHWIASASDKPRLSITSANVGGTIHWYIGGDLAESGVTHRVDDQVESAKSELEICFPGLDPQGWKFKTVRISRAEGKDAAGKRPDAPVVRAVEGTRAIAVWPTKLVMAPAAAENVLKIVQSQQKPSGEQAPELGSVARPDYALPPWQFRD